MAMPSTNDFEPVISLGGLPDGSPDDAKRNFRAPSQPCGSVVHWPSDI
jgi:hypothetical protein